jgi:hypothetical protein
MPTSSKSKRKSERKSRSTRSSKIKKTTEIVENDIEAFENGGINLYSFSIFLNL